jgi:hypothetical protein
MGRLHSDNFPSAMPNTLTNLLNRSLDFAGLFPPASLSVSDALRHFRQEQKPATALLVSRFVCPVLRLDELASVASEDMPLVISTLPRGGRSHGEFLANLETDMATVHRLGQVHDGALTFDTIEIRPPSDSVSQIGIRKLSISVSALLARSPSSIRQIFVEIPPAPSLAAQLEPLAELNATGGPASPVWGYKLRTGGSEASATPTAAQVAASIATAATLALPMKCTGGLHHPLPSGGGGGAPSQHGFVNVLIASSLAATAPTPPEELAEVLAETDPSVFVFSSRSLSWRNRKISSAEIARARAEHLQSFGSCHAELPRLELQKLGWWPVPKRLAAASAAAG